MKHNDVQLGKPGKVYTAALTEAEMASLPGSVEGAIMFSSYKHAFYVYDGASWNRLLHHSPNRGTRLYNSAPQTFATGSVDALEFDSAVRDDESLHSPVSNITRMTFGIPGWYFITGNVAFVANATGRRMLAIRINGTTQIAHIRNQAVTDASQMSILNISTLYYFEEDDYIELVARQDSGGDLDTSVQGDYSPIFTAYRLL